MECLLNAALLVRIGEALHGDYWQKKLAADLGISDRAFRVWRRGAHGFRQGFG
jgi:hypothetical protein